MARTTQSSATVNTTKTVTATSTKASTPRRGPQVLTNPNVFQQAASLWNTMDGDEKNSYAALAAQINDPLVPNGPAQNNAYGTFVRLASASIATNQTVPSTALPYAPPPPLPPMQLVASYVNTKFTLILVPNTPYAHPIAVKGAKPTYAANTIYKSTSFKKLGSIPAVSDHIDITALYQTHYHVPGTGYKIALEITGVAPGGFHTENLIVVGIVGPVAASASLSDPNEASSHLKIG